MEVSSVALFSYLLDDLYGMDRSGSPPDPLYPGASADSVVRAMMAKSFLRKLSDEEAVDAKQLCLNKFLEANSLCRTWQLDCSGSWDEELFGTFKQVLDDFLHPGGEFLVHSWFDLLRSGRAGPGASLGANGEDFFTKFFASKITTTSSELYELYNEWCAWFPILRDAEISRVLTHGAYSITPSSSMSFVRKTRNIARSICTEPSLNMYYQLGLGAILERRLEEFFGISMALQQERNRNLACRGSLDASLVTIDLESASDSISLGLCNMVLPESLLEILYKLRSARCRVNGQEVHLEMMSTMGNGFTFPLQTLIFSSVVVACGTHRFGRNWLNRADSVVPKWGVFGDDIICPQEIARDVCRLLRLLGFRINSDKSFFEGPFRESCGGDFYRGVNTRGIYLKSLRTIQDRYVAINLMNEWSARTGILLPRAVGYLKDSVPWFATPAHEALDAGIRVPSPMTLGTGVYHSRKQRYLYRCYEVVTPCLSFGDDGTVSTPRLRGKRIKVRKSNPYGALQAFLGGYIRNRSIRLPLKQGERPIYRTRWKVSPFWGPDAGQMSSQDAWYFWKRWNSAAEANLLG